MQASMWSKSRILSHARLAVVLAGLAFSFPARGQDAKPKAEAEAKLPAASEIIGQYVKNIGGKEAYAKIQSQKAKGKFEMPAQGLSGDLLVFSKRPNKLLVKIDLPGVGQIMTGYDGKVGWSLDPAMGPMLMEGDRLVQIKDQADFDAILHDSKLYKSMETVGLVPFEGRDCYKLKLVRMSGQVVTEYYEKKTGLLVGLQMTAESPYGPLDITNIFSDYQKSGSIVSPRKIVQKMGPIEQVMTLKEIEFDSVTDGDLVLPDQIKALVK